MGGRRGGGLKREEIHVYLKLIQFVVHQKLMQHFKAIRRRPWGLGRRGVREAGRVVCTGEVAGVASAEQP